MCKNGRKDGDAFEEHSNGLTIVSAVTEGRDVHLSRARLAPSPTPGKAVHCALPQPCPSRAPNVSWSSTQSRAS
ncbi:hypothetical protein GCM10022214_66780 [Actinomadura miaoliensis]|uniref:Uncharacterized protein n=1 Tax=Actinomadura miaoliensis TaxID=430685 RepID=A0ABP7WR47_9ACTN